MESYNAIVIGGGFYGLSIALFLYEELNVQNILIIEKEADLMSRASYTNQARVHNGYHYPRSLLTAYRSKVNFPRFVEEYKNSISSDFTKYYAIAKHLSKVNSKQFEAFVKKIDAEIKEVPSPMKDVFNPKLIEKAFVVQEYAFDSYKLRDSLLNRIAKTKAIKIVTNEEVLRIEEDNLGIFITTNRNSYVTKKVFNCAYSQINQLHRSSGLPLVSLKHEIAEMSLIDLPYTLKDFSVTVMDGPFFSIMPFPSTPHHTLSHVRYTPHMSWVDDENTSVEMRNPHQYLRSLKLSSNYPQMLADVRRYVPALKDVNYVRSIWEVKTVLLKSENDDSRPILFRSDFGIEGYVCIMGSKLDNIYDVFEELASLYDKKH